MASDGHLIRLEKEGPLAIVYLTNPPLNVLHPQMAEELDACFTALATDPEVVVAIITGDGERACDADHRPPGTRGRCAPALVHCVALIAQRKPIVRSSNSGSAEILAVTRNASGRSAHEPPRSTRFSPWAGPVGFFFWLL